MTLDCNLHSFMPSRNTHPQGTQKLDTFGYEKRDASGKGVFLAVAGLFVVLVLVELIVHFIVADFRKSPPPTDRYSGAVRAKQARDVQSSYPKLQIAPPTDLARFREQETQALNSYGWVDKNKGIVRMPIDRAMDLVLQKGLPVRQPGQPGKAGASTYEMQEERPNSPQPEIRGTP